jgi:cobalt-zinc-cadmium efflux system outer membrane protein
MSRPAPAGVRGRRKIGCSGGAVCILTLAVSLSAAAHGVSELTIEQAAQLAMQHNPTLRAKEREHEATRATEITAGLRPNPTASYAAEQLGNRAIEAQHTLALSQTIELGGKRQRRILSAQAATRVSAFEVADVRRHVVAEVKKAFTDVLVAQAMVKLASENLQTLDEIERVNRLRAEKGEIAQLELLRVQTQRFAFERDLIDGERAVQTAKIALRTVVGPAAVAPEFIVEGELAFRDLALDRERLVQQALERRPDLRAVEAGRERARADLDLARANASWDIAPQVQYQRIGPDHTFGVGISIPLRVFDRNQGEIARTRAEVARADQLRDAATNQARADVETAFAAVLTELKKVRRLRDLYLPQAQRVRETVDFAYRRGGLSVLDLLDAQRTYRETALEHVRALGRYWSQVYQLEAAVGSPLEP